ncbi:Gfo/Idh/MocA family oxidoreductase [Streptomyces sp. NPDC048845]|uniref:Gfo/Idh/MocA family protein n=1 Tax=Streptomyces sp. NPDC048845 TaxID=3155390 RepID=UPI003418DBEF
MADAYPAPLSRGEVGWGALATGGIAHAFTRDLITHGHRVAAVGSRSADSARAFAGRWGIERAHGSYEELVADPDVDIVYVATLHNFHAANATATLESGMHVLVEKAFTVNAAEARAVYELARGKGLLAMEAMWTRFLPHMAYVRSVIERGLVGDIRSLHAVRGLLGLRGLLGFRGLPHSPGPGRPSSGGSPPAGHRTSRRPGSPGSSRGTPRRRPTGGR